LRKILTIPACCAPFAALVIALAEHSPAGFLPGYRSRPPEIKKSPLIQRADLILSCRRQKRELSYRKGLGAYPQPLPYQLRPSCFSSQGQLRCTHTGRPCGHLRGSAVCSSCLISSRISSMERACPAFTALWQATLARALCSRALCVLSSSSSPRISSTQVVTAGCKYGCACSPGQPGI